MTRPMSDEEKDAAKRAEVALIGAHLYDQTQPIPKNSSQFRFVCGRMGPADLLLGLASTKERCADCYQGASTGRLKGSL